MNNQNHAMDENTLRPPLVPKDYIVAPIFAATRQTESREIIIKDKIYEIGGFNPLDPSKMMPALDIRHGRALFVLLSFRDTFKEEKTIKFSMNEFCRRYAGSNGGRYSRDIMKILSDLVDCWFRIKLPDGTSKSYRIIEKIEVNTRPIRRKDAKSILSKPQSEIWLDHIELSSNFHSLFEELENLSHIRLDVLTKMSSNLAQSIYTFLPSRAHHHSLENPFEITLTNLLAQVGCRVPPAKWERKKLFTQNKNSILSQLNGKPTLCGTLKVDIVETTDKKEYKLICWIDKLNKKLPLKETPLLKCWIKGGGKEETYRNKLGKINALDDYELNLISSSGAEFEGNGPFFQITKALLGSFTFKSVLSEAKGFHQEGSYAVKKNPTARLIHMLMQAVKSNAS